MSRCSASASMLCDCEAKAFKRAVRILSSEKRSFVPSRFVMKKLSVHMREVSLKGKTYGLRASLG